MRRLQRLDDRALAITGGGQDSLDTVRDRTAGYRVAASLIEATEAGRDFIRAGLWSGRGAQVF